MAQPLTRANTSKQTVTKTISGDATQVQPLSMMPPGGGNPFNIPNRIFLVPNRGLYHKEAPISSVTPEGLWPWAVVQMLLSRFVPASLEAWHSESVLLPSMHTTLEELFDRRNLWSRAAATMLPLEPLKPIRALKKKNATSNLYQRGPQYAATPHDNAHTVPPASVTPYGTSFSHILHLHSPDAYYGSGGWVDK